MRPITPMGEAPSMPTQTPVNYLKGGGAGMFSAQCIAALLKAKINPEWCGSYAHVSEKVIRPAKNKCEEWDQAVAEGRPTSGIPKPTAEDRYLASCQSGHLVRDACFREQGKPGEGSTRGDPCANLIDGYISRHAPSIPQAGTAGDSETQHGSHTRMEEDQARTRGEGRPYPPGERHADEDARVGAHVARHPGDFARVEEETKNQPAGTDKAQGAIGSASQATGSTDNGAKGTTNKDATKPDDAGVPQITGESAAECLNNWRKAAEKEMFDNCQASVERRQNYVDAVTKHLEASTPEEAAQILRNEAEEAEEKLREAVADGASDRAIEKAKKRAAAAKGRATRFCNARCLAEQGRRIDTPGQRMNGRAA